ncbi:hypothetical protein [Edaphobacillus lindanitolerans]|uniref:Uncharacterized protein n=1 Tax=Edaphobacillus lindanitolerans TaxID=550447 RepID=A0A1U7PLB4_9BACI|nr:hypothetical protein [Edaphobacillus lindanitolerans]SIT68156.1 hypothetical protein SAMN05428946_0329 [Edaphobacillus lindanitolerans]
MKQVIHVIRKADVEKQYVNMLTLELDYELATLYDAMSQSDSEQQEKSKKRLKEIHTELEKYDAFAAN